VTDLLRSYGAAMKVIGNVDKQETGRWLNNRAENSHLRSIGTPGCLAAADRLEASIGSQAGFDLHLRRAGLSQADAQVVADGMLRANAGNALSLKSFSASYNPELGDVGAATLATTFPATMTELGLVGCSVGDAGDCDPSQHNRLKHSRQSAKT